MNLLGRGQSSVGSLWGPEGGMQACEPQSPRSKDEDMVWPREEAWPGISKI